MAGKSFKASIEPINPALQFISAPAEPEERPDKPPRGFRVNPLYVETKSRRLQLLMQPSLYDKVKRRAAGEGVSVNELVHALLDRALSQTKE